MTTYFGLKELSKAYLEQVLSSLDNIEGGRLYVRHLLVHPSHGALRLAQLPGQVPSLQALAPHLELTGQLEGVPLKEPELKAKVEAELPRVP